MAERLEPCPFCGGEPFMEKSTRYPRPRQEPVDAYTVVCKNIDCIGYMADNWYRRSEKQALKAWNTRFKRTCKDIASGAHDFTCSECGAELEVAPMKPIGKHETHEFVAVSFCPSCGSEVVDD